MDLGRHRPAAKTRCIWDTKQPGLVLRIRPSGFASLAFVYQYRGRSRWFTIPAGVFLKDARIKAAKLRLQVMDKEEDPAGQRKTDRDADTFAHLADRYLREDAQQNNKSWKTHDYLVRKELLPRWGSRLARDINRADVKAMLGAIESPSMARQTWAAASAIFAFGIEAEVLTVNPVHRVKRPKHKDRERVLSDTEIKLFWPHLSPPLRVLLLTGQRSGEVLNMRREHVKDNWWELPGDPVPELGWPGTKNKRSHRVWLPQAARDIIGSGETGRVFERTILHREMREICQRLGINDKVTPHDFRRTHGTTITTLGSGTEAMNRIQNHIEGGIQKVYDRYKYAAENKRIMEAVADHIMALAEGRGPEDNVVPMTRLDRQM
jgi:integrase